MSERVNLRRQLYSTLHRRVDELLGKESAGFKRYQERYHAYDKAHFTNSHRDELLRALEASQVVLLADFHALEQSQKTNLRLIKNLARPQDWVLFLECIEAKYQKHVELFLAGKMTETDFLRKVQWQKHWGFPWKNYRPIFEWAKKNKVFVQALNLRKVSKESSTLKERDDFFAKVIQQTRLKFPHKKSLVLVGELHLAMEHLPSSLLRYLVDLKEMDLLLVLQNLDELYFHLMEKKAEVKIEVVKLKDSVFCVLSVVPWIKWQSYLHFLEESFHSDESELEYTDHVAHYLRILSKDLGAENVNLSDFEIKTSKDLSLKAVLSEFYNKKQISMIFQLLKEKEALYLPNLKLGLLGKASENQQAALAMSILHAQKAKQQDFYLQQPAQFLLGVWLESFCYLGSKLINPKRKAETLDDIRSQLQQKKAGPEFTIAHQFLVQNQLSLGSKVGVFSYFRAIKLIGGVLGEKFYRGFIDGHISTATLRRYLNKDLSSKDFASFFAQTKSFLDQLPEPFLSKHVKL